MGRQKRNVIVGDEVEPGPGDPGMNELSSSWTNEAGVFAQTQMHGRKKDNVSEWNMIRTWETDSLEF